MMVCQGMMEAHLECEEPASVDMESEEKYREVSEEYATVETGKAPRRCYRDQHLNAGRNRKPKELTQGDRGS
jgi:hypothetical protein